MWTGVLRFKWFMARIAGLPNIYNNDLKLTIPQYSETGYNIFRFITIIYLGICGGQAAKIGSEISYKSLWIKEKKNEKCCKLMNEICDLGVTKFLSHITSCITYWNFLNSNCWNWKLGNPTAAVGLAFYIEFWFTSRTDCLIMAHNWNVAIYL